MITGSTYMERGRPVTVITQWATTHAPQGGCEWLVPPKKNGPRNVAIRREDGTMTIRPFRGLRKPEGSPS